MPRLRWLRWRGAVLITIAAASWPLHVLAVNVIGIVRPERVYALMAIIWLVGMLLVALLTRFGVPVEAAENTAFVALLLAMNGGPILQRFGLALTLVILVGCSALTCWVSIRMERSALIVALVWGSAVAFAVGPLIDFVDSWQTGGGESLVAEVGQPTFDLKSEPDIFLVIFDGYPGRISTEQDGLGVGEVDVVEELRGRGFEVPRSSWSSYWATMLSIPSLLEMNYPVAEEGWRGIETRKQLQGVISGGNVLVNGLRDQGYTTHMVESGWSGASCTEAFDECIPSPLVDEATYLILRNTVAWQLLKDSPGPYVLGTIAGFDWLAANAPRLSRSPDPDFVFMHVVSPHPPLLLDGDCSVDFDLDRTGTGFNVPGVPTEERAQYLIEQMDCMDREMVRIADAVGEDDLVVFVSDHGTDRRYQANPDLTDWDRETIVERFNNFLAVRFPNDCSLGDQVLVPNALRLVLNCISSEPMATLPERMWVNPMVELDQDLVAELLSMRASTG